MNRYRFEMLFAVVLIALFFAFSSWQSAGKLTAAEVDGKLASLEVVLTPVSGDLVIPDLRWPVGGGLLALFLLVGWVRAARRSR